MTAPDPLLRAAEALRQSHTGQSTGAGFTRARILSSVERQRRRRRLRWTLLSPLGALALAGSAWAQSTGSWPLVWNGVSAVVSRVLSLGTERADASAPSTPAPLRSSEAPPSTTVAAPPEPPPPEPPPPQPSPSTIDTRDPLGAAPSEPLAPVPPRSPGASRRSHLERRPRPTAGGLSPRSPGAPARQSTAEPAADPELAVFRAAHDLHFSEQRPREAIDAYREYLAQFPEGRFVPEARYNTALNWIKLGNRSAARAALEPFAAGAYGGYRKSEARQLLEALERGR